MNPTLNSQKTSDLKQQLNQLAHELYGAKKLFQIELDYRNQVSLTIEEKGTLRQSKYLISVRESNDFLTQWAQCQDFKEKADLFYHFLSYSGATRMKDWSFAPLHPIVIPGTLIDYAKDELKRREAEILKKYYQKIQDLFASYAGSQDFLIQTWDHSLRKLIKKAPLFQDLIPTLTITEDKRFDSLVLTSPTYTVVLKQELSRNELSFEADAELIQRLFKIEDTLTLYLPYIHQIEQLLNWTQTEQHKICQTFESMPDYSQISTFYPCVEQFIELSTPGIHYKQLRLTFRSGGSYALDEWAVPDLQTFILKELENHRQLIEEQIQIKKEEMSRLQCESFWLPILAVVEDSPQKGLKTYVDILRGSKAAKIKVNDYHLLNAYGQLSHLSSVAVENYLEEAIQNQWVKRQTFKASFGRYDGLILTHLGRKILKANPQSSSKEPTPPQPIHSFSEFLKRLQAGELAEGLIPRLTALNPLTLEEVQTVITFLSTQRPLYRTQETLFLESIAKIFPPKGYPLIDLNITLSSGVTQKTFKQLKNLLTA